MVLAANKVLASVHCWYENERNPLPFLRHKKKLQCHAFLCQTGADAKTLADCCSAKMEERHLSLLSQTRLSTANMFVTAALQSENVAIVLL